MFNIFHVCRLCVQLHPICLNFGSYFVGYISIHRIMLDCLQVFGEDGVMKD